MSIPNFFIIRLLLSLFVFFSIVATIRLVTANPTTVDPSKSLSTHGTLKGVPELAAEAEKTAAEAFALLEEANRLMESGNMDRFPGRKVANIVPKLRQAFRNREQLAILGEPLSADLEMRLNVSNQKLHDHCLAYIGTPAGIKVRNAMATRLQKEQPKRLELYEKVIKLVAERKFQEAENMLLPVGDEMFTENWFIPLTVRLPFQTPYNQAASAVETPMRNLRSIAANQELNQVIDRIKPDAMALDTWGRGAAGQLQTGGLASWDNREPVDAVAVFDELMRRWKIGHTALQRIAALQWVIERNGGTIHAMGDGGTLESAVSAEPTNSLDEPSKRQENLTEQAIRWNDTALRIAVEIIKADSSKVAPEAIPQRHQNYLERSATILSTAGANSVKTALAEALGLFVSRNPAYAQSVEQYSAATSDVMIFRSRIAQAQAKNLSGEFSPADAVVRDATTADPQCRGLYSPDRSQPALATLYEPTQKIMTLRGPRLLNKNVRVDNVVTMPSQNPVSLSHFSGRTYASFTPAVSTQMQREKLNADLLVDQSSPPLSLDAAFAIRNAEVGNYVAVGGRVASAQLESMITRFASVGLVESSIIPSGSIVSMQPDVDAMTQMAMRLEITPAWVQHEMFVATIPTSP